MMRWLVRSSAVLGASMIMVLSAHPAGAQLVDEEAVGRLTIGGGIGFIVPSMSDVNSNIDVVNPFLSDGEVRTLDHVDVALLTSLDVRYRLGHTPKEEPDEEESLLDRISIGFSWGAINSWSQFNVSRVGARFYSRATTYNPYVLYHFPYLEGIVPRVQVYAGGGPLFLQSGHADWILHDRSTNNFIPEGDISELAGTARASGSGTGLNFIAGGSFQLNNRFSVALDFGYRLAKISNLSLDEAVGEDLRFPGDDTNPDSDSIIRRPGDWAVIDFFLRDPDAVYNQISRRADPDAGGCADCPLYYSGGPIDVDYSGPYSTFSLRINF